MVNPDSSYMKHVLGKKATIYYQYTIDSQTPMGDRKVIKVPDTVTKETFKSYILTELNK